MPRPQKAKLEQSPRDHSDAFASGRD